MQEENLERAYNMKLEIKFYENLKYLLTEDDVNVISKISFEFKNGKNIVNIPVGLREFVRKQSIKATNEILKWKKEELKNLLN